jgi:hypothetical protein
VKRTYALTAAIGLAATIVFLPGGAGAASGESGTGFVPPVSVPAPAPAIAPVPDTAGVPVPAVLTGALTAVSSAIPVPLPGPAAAVVTPASPETDEHMADLCAAREVFCQVDTSGHYIGS